jgi:hypothetical protein
MSKYWWHRVGRLQWYAISIITLLFSWQIIEISADGVMRIELEVNIVTIFWNVRHNLKSLITDEIGPYTPFWTFAPKEPAE